MKQTAEELDVLQETPLVKLPLTCTSVAKCGNSNEGLPKAYRNELSCEKHGTMLTIYTPKPLVLGNRYEVMLWNHD